MTGQPTRPKNAPLKHVTSQADFVEEPEDLKEGLDDVPSLKAGYGSSVSSGSRRHHRTKISKRLAGRHAPETGLSASMSSISSIGSSGSCPNESDSTAGRPEKHRPRPHHHHVRRPHHTQHIISQVAEWLRHEKTKQAARKATRPKDRKKHASKLASVTRARHGDDDASSQSSSDASDGTLALHQLEKILSASSLNINHEEQIAIPRASLDRQRSRKSSILLRKKLSPGSDSDAKEDQIVPSAEVALDNSKACRPSGRRNSTAGDSWLQFKREIVRLTHTLGIPGWRTVSIDEGSDVDVQRLSGALTNAVYVVLPPERCTKKDDKGHSRKRRPRKLLLRIYGPQVSHLIDRDSELEILCRLARQNIGPTLLGTFANGRFEQFLEATTLTARDIRDPKCSAQIAKRMRELHDGIELLNRERQAGPFVWQNWDKWKDRCEEVITWLDEQILEGHQGPARSCGEVWKSRGLVCGVEWPVFRQAVRKYRNWLTERCGGEDKIRSQLVFAHNDTQYGNLLRLEPGGESPLLLPENSHKQLQVIDFEYANANVPGLEFANHFTEWCYDYHMTDPFALHEKWYPTQEEQRRFIKAYVQHMPAIRPTLSRNANSSVSQFMLDSRAPPQSSYAEEERRRDEKTETEVDRLRQEARMWRLANSAQWVAWGIVQAKVEGMDEALEARRNATPTPGATQDEPDEARGVPVAADGEAGDHQPLGENGQTQQREGRELVNGQREEAEEEEEDDEEAFDYLAYAQERALLFWGDALQWGIVSRDELPEELLQKVKIVAE